MVAVVSGFLLMVPALVIYPSLPAALFGRSVRGPRGIERITRHPFFAGTALFALAHALLAPHAIGIVFFGGLALLAILGSRHQDGKLLANRGAAYADYLAATSAIPFAAIVAGRQRIVWKELPLAGMGGGLALALMLRHWHEAIFAHDGAWIIVVFVGGALIAGFSAWRRARRSRGERTPLRWNPGTLLIATAIGHTVVGVAMYHDAYAAILRDGFLDAVAPHVDRMVAFWFLLFSPVCFVLGQVVTRAIAHEDKPLIALLGWYVLGLGVVGAMGLPVSGFWLLIAIGVLMLRSARSAVPLSQYAHGKPA
jgi:protein-S-isoprenylcysteine O-methyltransferase Ste14